MVKIGRCVAKGVTDSPSDKLYWDGWFVKGGVIGTGERASDMFQPARGCICHTHGHDGSVSPEAMGATDSPSDKPLLGYWTCWGLLG